MLLFTFLRILSSTWQEGKEYFVKLQGNILTYEWNYAS